MVKYNLEDGTDNYCECAVFIISTVQLYVRFDNTLSSSGEIIQCKKDCSIEGPLEIGSIIYCCVASNLLE